MSQRGYGSVGLASSADLFACDRHHLCICGGPVIDIWHGPVSEKSSPPDRHEQTPQGVFVRLLTRFYSLGGRRPSLPPRSMLFSGRVFAKEPQAGIAVQFPIQGSPADPLESGPLWIDSPVTCESPGQWLPASCSSRGNGAGGSVRAVRMRRVEDQIFGGTGCAPPHEMGVVDGLAQHLSQFPGCSRASGIARAFRGFHRLRGLDRCSNPGPRGPRSIRRGAGGRIAPAGEGVGSPLRRSGNTDRRENGFPALLGPNPYSWR